MILRYEKNPILSRENVPFKVNSIFNAGAIKFGDKYLLLCRVELPMGRSHFVLATSDDGINFTIEKKPCLGPEDHDQWTSCVEWGIEDPRITRIGTSYYIIYTGYSRTAPLVMLARTDDFRSFEILGPVCEPSNKDAVLFPEKIGGLYWKIDRPSADDRRDMWINSSPDLINWGQHRLLTEPTPGSWEQNKIGASTPPARTDAGWLMLYHGVRGFGISSIYRQGVLLLDIDKPWRVIGKSREPILSPEFAFERTGDVPNVVFSTGWIIEPDGRVKIYYSGADMNICLAKTTVAELIEFAGK
jgi:predicted GH43/DUF377 family glycosyl hydrolase